MVCGGAWRQGQGQRKHGSLQRGSAREQLRQAEATFNEDFFFTFFFSLEIMLTFYVA